MDWSKLCDTDWFKSRPIPVQDAMKQYPAEKFYQKKDCPQSAVRIYGMVENADGTVDKAHVITAHIREPHGIIGGYPLDDLEEVNNWSEDQISAIKTMSIYHQEAFLKKDGVVAYMLDGPYSDNNQNYQCYSCGHYNSN